MTDLGDNGIVTWDFEEYELLSSTITLTVETSQTTYNAAAALTDDETCSIVDIVLVSITVFIAVISIPTSLWSIMSLYDGHSLRMEQQKSSPKSLYRITILYQLSVLLFVLVLIPLESIHCLDISDINHMNVVPDILLDLAVWTYIIHWTLWMVLHLCRLRVTFRDTLFELDKSHCIIFCVAISIVVLYILSLSVLLSFASDLISINRIIPILAVMTGAVFVALLTSVMLWLYLRRLFKVARQTGHQQTGHRSIDSMVRFTILSLFTTFATTIFMVCLCLRASDPNHGLFRSVTNLCAALNVFIDLLCISCSYGFGDRAYNKWCGYGHSRWMRYCTRNHDIVTIRAQSTHSTVSGMTGMSTQRTSSHHSQFGTAFRTNPSTESLQSHHSTARQAIRPMSETPDIETGGGGVVKKLNFHPQRQITPMELTTPQIAQMENQHLKVAQSSDGGYTSSEGCLEATEMKLCTEGNYVQDIRSLASLVVGVEHLSGSENVNDSFHDSLAGIGSL